MSSLLKQVTSEKSNTFKRRFTGYYASKNTFALGKRLKQHTPCHKYVLHLTLRVSNTGRLTGLNYNSDNSTS
jgi:hypothetical protein